MSIIFSLIKPWVLEAVKTYISRHPILVTTLTGSATVIFVYFTLFRKKMRKEKFETIKENKQALRKKQFEGLRSKYKLSTKSGQIANLDWKSLLVQLQSRKLTAVEVLQAYVAKSLDVTTFSNAVTEYYSKAFEIAEKLDKLPQVKGPLHGVPFCVKDDNNLEGMDSTLGFAKNCFHPKDNTAGIVAALMELGAVPFCKTNVPQTLLNYASDNPIFGTTSSSHNQKLGPGGSSSGTGALVGGKGAFFGTGTDIGGSLRIPAHFNGASSLKPTAGRMSLQGMAAVLPNIMGLDATTGIIGRDAHVVTAVYKNLLANNVQTKFDPLLAPIPWNPELYGSKKKLRIGYFTEMDFFPPVGDTVEVVEKAIKALKSQGHTLVPMTVPDGARIMRCAANFLMADECRALVTLWKGEEVAECAKLNQLVTKVPFWLTKLVTFLMKRRFFSALYSPSVASISDSMAFKSFQLWDNTGEKKKITDEILETWKKLELDCCVCPVMPFPALPVGLPGLLPVGAVYTMTWNVVNFPAGVVRFGTESGKKIDDFDNRGDQAFKLAQKGCKESIGSPIGIQVVGLPFKEELVLRVMEDLDDYALKNKCY